MSQSIVSNDSARPARADIPAAHSGRVLPGPLVWIAQSLPTIVTFCLLGGVLWYGRATHWKMPAFAAVFGGSEAAVADWCEEHSVPESACVMCKPELFARSKSFGFCQVHGVAECVISHPELAQSKETPSGPKYDTVAAIGILDRSTNNSRSTLHESLVQFTSRDAVDRAGVDIAIVGEQAMEEAVTSNAEVVFDPTRVARLSARLPGTVVAVRKFVGDPVEPGDILALIDASQVGQLKSELVQAVVQLQLRANTLERLRRGGAAIAPRDVTQAEFALKEGEIALSSARQALVNLGFTVPDDIENADAKQLSNEILYLGVPEETVRELPHGAASANLIPIRATYGGMVIESELVAGEVIDSAKPLFVIADPSRLWLNLAIRSEDAKHISLGQVVEFQADGTPAKASGTVSWISPTISEQTRTLSVRVTLDSGLEGLRDHTFGMGRIVLRRESNAIVVPKVAIQSTADATFVFIRDKNYFEEGSPKVFHVRQVRVGASDGENVELLAGALPGEVVVAQGSNVLLAQLLKSNLGAGCGCEK